MVVLGRLGVRLLLPLVLCRIELEELAELVVLALVNQVLAVNLTELVVVPKDFDLVRNQTFVSIVVPLDDKTVDSSEVLAPLLVIRSRGQLGKYEVVVAVCEDQGDLNSLLDGHLVVMPVYCKALHPVLLGDLETCIVVV